MIFTTIFDAFTAMVIGLLHILPTLPPLPVEVLSAINAGNSVVSNTIPVIHMMYGEVLFNAIILLLVVIWQFENIYALTMWVLRKLPFINIK